MKRAAGLLVPILLLGHAPGADASAVASGRNWRIAIDRIECEGAGSLILIGTRIRYLGPKGPVEAPLSRLVDGKGRPHAPKSLIWRRGSKPIAEWLSAGGLANIQSEDIGEVQLKFEAGGASGELKLEFGDIRAISLTRKRTSACEGLLKPGQIEAVAVPRPARVDGAKPGIRVYRNAYPCSPPSRTISAEHPPYLPSQLLLFGRGYLPNARQVELPMGKAPAQSYSYVGPDDLNAVEAAARQALLADFPEYRGAKHFAFNWGAQKAASGNEAYSIGIYAVRPCPK